MQTENSLNQRDHVTLTSFALARIQPRRLRQRDLVVPVEAIANPQTWCGVYGPRSADAAFRESHHRARADGLSTFVVRSWYPLRDLERHAGPSITRQTAETTGYVHIDRTKSCFRRELHGTVMKYLARVLDAPALEALRGLSLKEVLLRHPYAAGWILRAEPAFEMVVSSVWMRISVGVADSCNQIQIGTIRRSRANLLTSELVHAQGRVAITN